MEFRSGPVDAGPFSLQQIGSGSFRNLIDVFPFVYSGSGTTHASMFTDFGATEVDMTFDNSVFAWGADFYLGSLNELLDFDVVLNMGGTLATLSLPSLPNNTGFFGFVTSAPPEQVDKLTFKSRTNLE